MTSQSFFYDQHSRASHLGGVRRPKRNSQEFNQALYQAKLAESSASTLASQSNKSSFAKHPEPLSRQLLIGKSQVPFIPDVLVKELDTTLKIFDTRTSEDEAEDSPNVSLPSALIVQFHATWTDLIADTEYHEKIWRTKAAEDAWRQYTQRKRVEQIRAEKRQTMRHQRQNSRASNASGKYLPRRPSLSTNTQSHQSRPTSRGSLISTVEDVQDTQRPSKPAAHPLTIDQGVESNRHGIHVEFKFSTQLLRKAHRHVPPEPKFVLFEVQQPSVDIDQEVIVTIQNKCKRLLAETKQKILATSKGTASRESNPCRYWFYDDNHFLRNKTSLLSLNESNRGQRPKFVLSILRRSVPEKYHLDIDIPSTKKKCYVELPDGSSQIYYPSGRLAVLRLRSPICTTLFFDDTHIAGKQFLGLVTSSGNVLIMQPTFHARFLANHHTEHAYLCDGKTGLIENQLPSLSKRRLRRRSTLLDDDSDGQSPSLDSSVQFQLNDHMQLEYNSPSNIRFAFACENEEFKYQLGITTSKTPTPTLTDTTTSTKRLLDERRPTKKRSSSMNNHDTTSLIEKQRTQSPRVDDEQTEVYQLPAMKELLLARKRIQTLCEAWLNECRTVLGVMDIDAYCLFDLPSTLPPPETNTDVVPATDHVPLLTKRAPLSIDFIPSVDKQSSLRRSINPLDRNLIARSIEQFIPQSDLGRAMKQRIFSGKRLFASTLPVLK